MGPGMNQPAMNQGHHPNMGKGQGQMPHGQHVQPVPPVQPVMNQMPGHGQWQQQQHGGQDMHMQHHPQPTAPGQPAAPVAAEPPKPAPVPETRNARFKVTNVVKKTVKEAPGAEPQAASTDASAST